MKRINDLATPPAPLRRGPSGAPIRVQIPAESSKFITFYKDFSVTAGNTKIARFTTFSAHFASEVGPKRGRQIVHWATCARISHSIGPDGKPQIKFASPKV